MDSTVTAIGRCKGCNKFCKLDDEVCIECLSHPKRGRKWAEMSHQIRTNPAFALQMYNEIGIRRPERELAGKMLFIRMYGLPSGAVCPVEIQDFVNLPEEVQEPIDPKPVLRLVR